jgi:hypothetical protein
MPYPSPARPVRRLAIGALLLAAATFAHAQLTEWEFFVPRERQFSLTRKQSATMDVRFGDGRVDLRKSWANLSAEEQAIVRKVQPAPLADTDTPPYPKAGLMPIIERLHRVRGPADQPLRLFLEIDELGGISAAGTGGAKVTPDFTGQMLTLMLNSGFKVGTCDGQPCKRIFVLDLHYVGP